VLVVCQGKREQLNVSVVLLLSDDRLSCLERELGLDWLQKEETRNARSPPIFFVCVGCVFLPGAVASVAA